ncbi:hypothetical protein Dda_7779 [Drechslerella dactyloides]|uniref:NB-ARC domain-containing protein n=1 Tax=Drechslerella dactyloides TaxID=74499 RepID=A0AAD6IR63_DREDA|nr:hypothetical protein Dda_7779 [Drechslerella dactyloides]
MLDESHKPCELPFDDENSYSYGSINNHNVVIACLPPGQPGKVSALKLSQPLARSFPNMQLHLFVGIGGGIPRNPRPGNPEDDIHLGDVVVGWPGKAGIPAVVQYDFRKAEENGKGQLLGTLDKPDQRTLFKVPFERDRDFTGRKDILKAIDTCFESESRITISGIGGVGKSHIALEYCYNFRDKNPRSSVIWVYCGTTTRFQEEYRDIAVRLDLPGCSHKIFDDILPLVRGWLSKDDNADWLMVLDDANFQESDAKPGEGSGRSRSLAEYIPYSSRGKVIITSSNKRIAELVVERESQVIEVEPMNLEEAKSLMSKKLPMGTSPNEITELVQLLHGIPLAITQCSACIDKNRNVSISRYLSWLKDDESRATILRDGIGGIQNDGLSPRTVLKTWELSFNEILRTAPQAAELLSLMCFLDAAKIPGFILSDDANSLKFQQAIAPLINFSFISLVKESEGQECFQMLGLVQFAMKEWLRLNKTFEIWLQKAVAKLCQRFPKDDYQSKESWQRSSIVAPHVEAVLGCDFKAPWPTSTEAIAQRAKLMRNYTSYLWRQGHRDNLANYCDISLKFHKDYLTHEPLLILESKSLKGVSLNSLGKFGEAAKIQEEVLADRKKILGKQHPDTLRSMNDLGQALRNQGKYKEAEEIYRKVLKGREKLFGIDNPETLTTMSNLANVLAHQGNARAAEEMFRITLKLEEDRFTKEHPSTLATMELLAETLEAQGKYQEAEAIHGEALELYISVLGENHPDTIWCLNGLATALLSRENLQAAEEKFRKSLELCREVFGSDNSHTLTIMFNLAHTLEQQQRYPKAEEVYLEAFGRMMELKKHSEELHLCFQSCSEGLIATLNNQGKTVEANEIYNETRLLNSLAIRKARPTGLSRLWFR